jgi:branched-chain amino acid transport system substrate-binding protein
VPDWSHEIDQRRIDEGGNMSRRWTQGGIGALAVAALIAAGCSSSSKKSATTATTATGSATTTATTAANATPIKVAFLLPFSGPSALNGAGNKPFIDTITKEPGHATIDGHPVQVVIGDDQGTAAGGASATHQLVDQDHVNVVIGSNLSAVVAAEVPVTTQSKTLEITLTGCTPICGDGTSYPYAFSIEFNRPVQGPATMARVKGLGKSSIAVLESLDPSGQQYLDALKAAAGPAGVTISKVVTFQPNSLDMSNQVAQLKAAGADLIYMDSVSGPDIANVVKAMDEDSYHPAILGNSALSGVVVYNAIPAASKSWANTWQASGFGLNMVAGHLSPEVQAWHDRMLALIGPSVNQTALNNSVVIEDAFDMFKAAVEATHSTDGPTLATWIQNNGFQGLRADFQFTASDHYGLSAATVGWAIPGPLVGGFLKAAPNPAS